MIQFYNSTDIPPLADSSSIEEIPLFIERHVRLNFQAASKPYFVIRYWSIVVFLAVVLISSCDIEPTKPTAQNQPDYFPLQVGNWWEYVSLDSSGTHSYESRIAVTGDSLLNGIQYYILQASRINTNTPQQTISYVTKDPEGTPGGTVISMINIIPINKYDSAIRKPLYFNKSIYEEWALGNSNDIFTIISKSDSTKVPAGFFYPNCVISEVQGIPESVVNSTYAPNVGLIASVPVFLDYGDRTYLTRAFVNGKSYP